MKTNFAKFLSLALLAPLLAPLPGSLRAQPAPASSSAPARFAVIDTKRTLDNYYKREQMLVAFKEFETNIKKDLSEQAKDFQANLDAFNKLAEEVDDPSISLEEKAKRNNRLQLKKAEIRNSKDNYDSAQARAQQTLQLKMDQMMGVLTKDIKIAVKDIASRGGYTFVLDSSVLLYTNGDNDITEQVLKQINAAAPPEMAKPAALPEIAKPGDKPADKKQKP